MHTPGPTLGHGPVRTARGFVFHAAVFLLAFLLFGVAQGSLLRPLVGWFTMDHADPHFVHDITFAPSRSWPSSGRSPSSGVPASGSHSPS